VKRLVGFVFCCALVVAACSSGGDDDDAAPSPPPTSAPAPGPEPTAAVSFRGDADLDGSVTEPSVRCNVPDLAGSSIAVLGQPRSLVLHARLAVQRDKVTVVVSSGSGDTYHERAFEGDGVERFDAARGAVIRSELAGATAGEGTTPGGIPAITAIEGTIHCGDQTPGSSTVTITGDTPDGRLDAAVLDPVRVECDATPGGDEVYASGIANAGTRRVFVGIGLTSDGGVTMNKNTDSTSRRYTAFGSTTITPEGAQVDATVVDEGTDLARALQVAGTLTCGRNAAG
jgi:hypothetical protein